ncbi:hypothetical protein ACFSWE_16645 [Leucobacter albus]|uniref:Uncharacterized protein n=1 Tax=Leucobacter albus TaxID=272210 RepID=A0ABW3TSZ3_9MICO
MSDTFTASNGKQISVESEEGLFRVGGMPLTSMEVVALREFFQHERDKELGRWRCPEGTDLVVYPLEVAAHTDAAYRECVVVDEATGSRQEFGSDLPQCHGGPFREAARAFFAAHPEPKPEWHDAKPGEVWAITAGGHPDEFAVQVTPEFTFGTHDGDLISTKDEGIVSARRIFPEAPSE